jgi:hypothetical protein
MSGLEIDLVAINIPEDGETASAQFEVVGGPFDGAHPHIAIPKSPDIHVMRDSAIRAFAKWLRTAADVLERESCDPSPSHK